jgi:hypothetical protein
MLNLFSSGIYLKYYLLDVKQQSINQSIKPSDIVGVIIMPLLIISFLNALGSGDVSLGSTCKDAPYIFKWWVKMPSK